VAVETQSAKRIVHGFGQLRSGLPEQTAEAVHGPQLLRPPALLHFGSFLAAGLAVTALARRLAPRGGVTASGATAGVWRARLAGATVPLLPAVVLVPALPAAEGWLLAAVVTALAVAVGPEARHRRPARLATPFFGMLLAGIAVSARLQGLAWSAIIAVVLLPRVLRAGRRRGWGLVWQLDGSWQSMRPSPSLSM